MRCSSMRAISGVVATSFRKSSRPIPVVHPVETPGQLFRTALLAQLPGEGFRQRGESRQIRFEGSAPNIGRQVPARCEGNPPVDRKIGAGDLGHCCLSGPRPAPLPPALGWPPSSKSLTFASLPGAG
jgi:hypothetical protein